MKRWREVDEGITPLIRHLRTRRSGAFHVPAPSFRRKSPSHPLNRTLVAPRKTIPTIRRKNIVPLPGTEPRILGRRTRSLVTMLSELYQLPFVPVLATTILKHDTRCQWEVSSKHCVLYPRAMRAGIHRTDCGAGLRDGLDLFGKRKFDYLWLPLSKRQWRRRSEWEYTVTISRVHLTDCWTLSCIGTDQRSWTGNYLLTVDNRQREFTQICVW